MVIVEVVLAGCIDCGDITVYEKAEFSGENVERESV